MGQITDAALWYLERGIQPVPLKAKSKIPLNPKWQDTVYTEETITHDTFPDWCNIGANLGIPSGNLIDIDLDHPAAIKIAPYFLPKTNARFGRPGKRNSHWLYFVDHTEHVRREVFYDAHGKVLFEIRGTGSQTMLPPSIHATWDKQQQTILKVNGPVTWMNDPDQIKIDRYDYPIIRLPSGLLAATLLFAVDYESWRGQGMLHHMTLALAGSLIRGNLDRPTVELMIELIYTIGEEDDKSDRMKAVRDTLNKWEADPDSDITGLPTLSRIVGQRHVDLLIQYANLRGSKRQYELTDEGNANRFVDRFAQELRYNVDNSHWYQWDGTHWEEDPTRQGDRAFHLGCEIPHQIIREAGQTKDDKEMAALTKWGLASQNVNRLSAIPRIARTRPEIWTRFSEFDADPMLFNVLNGVINLRTGGLEPHDPNWMMSKIAPVVYNERAKAPRWEAFLLRAMADRSELVYYLQTYVGYCLTGLTTEQIFTVFHGPRGNGKSTFVDTLNWIFGDYATTADPKTFMIKTFESRASSDVARLVGRRLVITSEAEKGHRFASALIKRLTGAQFITASFLYQDEFTFTPTFKLCMDTNDLPRVPADDEAMWDRLVTIPFDVNFRDAPDRILGFDSLLKEEAPGIMAWLVEGCLRWQETYLQRPDILRQTKTEYKADTDHVAQFMQERTVRRAGVKTAVRDLHAAYVGWCKLNDESHWSVQRFSKHLKTLGYEEVRPLNKVHFKDVELSYGSTFNATNEDEPIFPNGVPA